MFNFHNNLEEPLLHEQEYINYNPFAYNPRNNIQQEEEHTFFNNNPFIVNNTLLHESISSLDLNNQKEEKIQIKNDEENKTLLFFKSHNFTNDNNIIKRDGKINEDKKYHENLLYNLEDDMKCVICLNRFKEPLLCPYCHHFFCKLCIMKWFDENKENCVYCRKNMKLNDFIEISAFRNVLSFLDNVKENNNSYFSDKIKNNIDNVIILCSNKIHEKKESEENEENIINNENENINDNENKSKDKENICKEDYNETKADYYCFDCKKPYCSDCICLNDDDLRNCGHNIDHAVFNIEILNEIKLFDLLYEKENNKTIEKIEKLNGDIKEEINNLNIKKNNTLLFIEYIKNTYIKWVENKINDLKNMIKKNEEEINKIKSIFNDLDNFVNNLKNEKNIKTSKNKEEIKHNLQLLKGFDKIPEKTKNIINDIQIIKGNIKISEHMIKIIEIDINKFTSNTYNIDNNLSLILINVDNINIKNNYNNNPFLAYYYQLEDNKFNKFESEENNDNKKIKLKLIVKLDDSIYHFRDIFTEKHKYFFPILFNNENKFILLDEIQENDDFYLRKNKNKNGFKNDFLEANNNLNKVKYYRTFIDYDSLIVKNDNKSKDIKNSSKEKIKLCLQSLTIS